MYELSKYMTSTNKPAFADLLNSGAKDLQAKDARIAELEKFVTAFLDNFKPCDRCGGTGLSQDDTCPKCHGTREQIDSVGILYVDLKNEALELKG